MNKDQETEQGLEISGVYGPSGNDGPLPDLESVLQSITTGEIYRMQKNLGRMDALENMLMAQLRIYADQGMLDVKTLQSAMKTFADSVKLSTDIVSDKRSNLVNIVIQTQDEKISEASCEESSYVDTSSVVGIAGRKRIRDLMGALIQDVSEIDYEVVNEQPLAEVEPEGTMKYGEDGQKPDLNNGGSSNEEDVQTHPEEVGEVDTSL